MRLKYKVSVMWEKAIVDYQFLQSATMLVEKQNTIC